MGYPNAKTGTPASRPVVPWNKDAFVETQLPCRCEAAVAFRSLSFFSWQLVADALYLTCVVTSPSSCQNAPS